VSLTWSLAVNHPTATVRVVPTSGGHHVVVHHAFDGLELDDVREVLCRPASTPGWCGDRNCSESYRA